MLARAIALGACLPVATASAQTPTGWTAGDDAVTVTIPAAALGDDLNTIVIRGGMSVSLLDTDGGLGLRLSLPAGSTNAVLGVGRRGEAVTRVGLTLAAGGRVEAEAIEAPSPDIDRDGAVSGADMRLLLAALWRRCFCPEDANRDGRVDCDDIRFVGQSLHMTIDEWRAWWASWNDW